MNRGSEFHHVICTSHLECLPYRYLTIYIFDPLSSSHHDNCVSRGLHKRRSGASQRPFPSKLGLWRLKLPSLILGPCPYLSSPTLPPHITFISADIDDDDNNDVRLSHHQHPACAYYKRTNRQPKIIDATTRARESRNAAGMLQVFTDGVVSILFARYAPTIMAMRRHGSIMLFGRLPWWSLRFMSRDIVMSGSISKIWLRYSFHLHST